MFRLVSLVDFDLDFFGGFLGLTGRKAMFSRFLAVFCDRLELVQPVRAEALGLLPAVPAQVPRQVVQRELRTGVVPLDLGDDERAVLRGLLGQALALDDAEHERGDGDPLLLRLELLFHCDFLLELVHTGYLGRRRTTTIVMVYLRASLKR